MAVSVAVLDSIVNSPVSKFDSEFNQGIITDLHVSSSSIDRMCALHQLHQAEQQHPFWTNRLFNACRAGHFTLEDFRFIFSQYYLYSQNFTPYLAAIMANCDDDYFRARLSENMWEEGGGAAPENRRSEKF